MISRSPISGRRDESARALPGGIRSSQAIATTVLWLTPVNGYGVGRPQAISDRKCWPRMD